jgi:anti-sigma-K factor RskA
MNDHDHDRWRDDVAAYMLGALEPEDAAELERHAEGCERCRSEMRWLTAAVEALPEAAERLEPPPRLRERLLTEVRADAAGERRRSDAERYGAAAPGLFARASAWLRGLGSGPMGRRPVAGVAAAVLVVAVVAGFAIGGGVGGGGSGTSSFVSEQPSSGVTATVVRKGDGGTLHLTDVHKLPNDRVLEAWVRREGKIEPVRALFVPDREGHASTTLGDMKGVDTVMVTTEPPGGSEAPTSTPIVTVPIPQ